MGVPGQFAVGAKIGYTASASRHSNSYRQFSPLVDHEPSALPSVGCRNRAAVSSFGQHQGPRAGSLTGTELPRSRWRKRRYRSFLMAAAARPYWTGFLKLSLVTIAVRLYTATTVKERIRFHMIHEPTGERVRQQLVVPGTGPVERDEVVKGHAYEKGHYGTVGPAGLKRLRLETTDAIDITEFVDDVDPIYFDAPYYLVPDGSVAEEGYRVIREALRDTGKIAIGQVVVGGQ